MDEGDIGILLAKLKHHACFGNSAAFCILVHFGISMHPYFENVFQKKRLKTELSFLSNNLYPQRGNQ